MKTKLDILAKLCKSAKAEPRGTVNEIRVRLELINERTRRDTACAIAAEFDFHEWNLADIGF